MTSNSDAPAADAAETTTWRPARLWNRNFLLLWQGQFVSNLGDQAFLIALVFWIKDATGSASLMGLMLMLSSLPAVILGPVAGTFADRYSRRTIILVCDLLSGLAVLSLTGLLWFMPEATGLTITWVFVTALLLGIFGSFFTPAISAAVPDLVPQERVASANSISQAALELSTLLGQAVGGVLFRVLGAPLLLLFNGLSYLFSAVSEAFITIPQKLPEQPPGWRSQFAAFRRDLAAGLAYLWRAKGLRGLVLLSAAGNFFNVPIIVLLPFFVEDFLGLTPDWYGYLIAIYSAGTMAGYLFAGVLNLAGPARARVALLFMLGEPLCYAAIAVTGSPLAMLGIAALGGLMSGYLIITITTILQVAVPSELRGRVFGLLATISGTLVPVATGLAGIVADLSGQRIPLIYLGCSAAMLVIALCIGLSPSIRSFLALERLPEAEPAGPEQTGPQVVSG